MAMAVMFAMVCSFVLAMPDTTEGAKQGFNVFYWVMGGAAMSSSRGNANGALECEASSAF